MPPRKPKSDRPPKPPRAKKETAVKRETRSRHEKKRREEMNEVLSEMAELLPQEVISSGKLKKVDQKPRNPDKCFIIGNSVEMIRNSDYKPGLLSEPLTVDVFKITNSFMIFMHDFIVAGIEGDHRCIFDVEKDRMLGRDIRCFLDFESASKLPFLDPNLLIHQLQMRSFMAKAMSCIIKNSQENPSESILICVPNELPRIVPPPQAPPTFVQLTPPKSPPPSKLEVERPILAALLRKKDPPKPTFLEISPMPPSTSSTFLSPTSSTCSTVPLTTVTTPRRVTVVPPKRKRIRSMNVIVESYPLDEKDEEEETPAVKRQKKRLVA
ncbi:hypothetical protein GCK72_011548 [Caenorhabditis remanei]|uniref:BHLH domain-containing protein n=1 Tax=Caenorhabditis remanei TaxID=31234 RepID=A0A6A5HA68_CAERE|nr:hypothetical protein GCK72_011548 [Caenorhabditis remanei]KAF1763282.1 hypothetical protein GCK72_011548 [Caenorhabditis remanei]